MAEDTPSSGQRSNAGLLTLIAVVIIVPIVLVAVSMLRNGSGTSSPSESPAVDQASAAAAGQPEMTIPSVSSTNEPVGTLAPETKTFTVVAENFSFSLKEIKVNKGDTVKIVFQNNEGNHDWIIDEFNAHTKQISAGKTDEIEFVADGNAYFNRPGPRIVDSIEMLAEMIAAGNFSFGFD